MISSNDFKQYNIPLKKQVDLLAKFLMENFSDEFGNNKGEGAIEMAVRLLEKQN